MTPPRFDLTFLERRYPTGASGVARGLQPLSASIIGPALTVVWGPSGSGKTTLLNLMGGLDHPSGGTILADGVDLATLSEDALSAWRGLNVGLLFQEPRLLSGLPVWANVALALVPKGVPSHVRRKAAEVQLERLGLGDASERDPSDLSGGEAHRVALARALLNDPRIILADEPTASLDRASARTVLDVLKARAGAGSLVVIASHDPEVREAASLVLDLGCGAVSSAPGILAGTGGAGSTRSVTP